MKTSKTAKGMLSVVAAAAIAVALAVPVAMAATAGEGPAASAAQEVPAASPCAGGHSYKKVTVRAKGCKAGYVGKRCRVCGKVVKTKTLKAKAKHRYKAVTVKATCTTAGYKGKRCTVCGKVVKTKTLKAGHKWEKVAGKKATCTEPGTTSYRVCKACGKHDGEAKEIPALGHEWSDYYVCIWYQDPKWGGVGSKQVHCCIHGDCKANDMGIIGEYGGDYKPSWED